MTENVMRSVGKAAIWFGGMLLICLTLFHAGSQALAAQEVELDDIPSAQPGRLVDKTLVAWVALDSLDQQGGSALTVNDTTMDRFDGIVFGELRPRTWMAGSNGFLRTARDQEDWLQETAGPDQWVQIAIVYRKRQVTMLRNGRFIAEYEMSQEPAVFGSNTAVVFGQRHLRQGVEHLTGRILDARIYASALSSETIAQMEPGRALDQQPAWAWWDFANTGPYDRMGRFNQTTLTGGARLDETGLVLEGQHPRLLATQVPQTDDAIPVPDRWTPDGPVPPTVVQNARALREKLLSDPYRPGYHFCVPEDQGMPGDPNGCFFANGRYHLMYLYHRTGGGFSWGHVSSHDLVRWRHHPDAIGPGNGDEGCFSGGGFVDDDGTVYLSYWMLFGDKGIGLAASRKSPFGNWVKLDANPVIRSTEFGVTETQDTNGKPIIYGSADPSNIWKHNDRYYMLTGNLPVLNKYGRGTDAAESVRGDHLFVFESADLKKWDYRGQFYERRDGWTDASEDNMCPSFLPLPTTADGGSPSGKHLLLFISHNRGCQYYVGTYRPDSVRFEPESHGRMTWVDNTFFAPEALVDDRGRQIMWAWLTDNPAGDDRRGWSGVYGLPRSLWLGSDGTLRMKPVRELESLRINPVSYQDIELSPDQEHRIEGVPGESCELMVTIPNPSQAARVGLQVRCSEDGKQKTWLYYDAENQTLCLDARQSGNDGRQVLESAPCVLNPGEPLVLRVFIDRSVIEVFANDRQAICRRVYPDPESNQIRLFVQGGTVQDLDVSGWEMMPANPY